jgi:chromosome segregation ATPase
LIEAYHQRLKAASLQSTILEKKLNEMQKILAKQRETLSTRATAQNAFGAQKQVINLENRLDKALMRYNKSLEVITKMRESIGVLRHERNAFDTVYKRYEKELQDIKKQINDISENCANSYESR